MANDPRRTPRPCTNRWFARKPLAALVLALCPAAGLAQEPPPERASTDPREPLRRQARAVRVETPPLIDGRLDDPAWALARPIGELFQIDPQQGVPPSEASEIRVVYDEHAIYFGLRLFDREPDKIIVKTMERDGLLSAEDYVMFVLDTHLDRRNAYFFQLGAAGSKGDALVTNNGADFNKPWDGIWEGKARIDELGWTAEISIPFHTLSFREDLDTWGFNLERVLARRNEDSRWASPNREHSLFNLYMAGDLVGIEGVHGGLGLDVKPFFVGTWSNDRSLDDSSLLGQPGLDAFYRLTPRLTAALTLNTDFAETEVDARRVNLTRFPLFFPEQRDFFLQDAGVFRFADLGNDLIPFFSRRIGLASDGSEVPIEVGLKLTGRAGPYNLGVLDVLTDESGDLERQNLFVTRIARNVGRQSTFGGILTHGDPRGGEGAATLGLDYNYRTNDFLGDKNLRSSWWILGTTGEDEERRGLAYGGSLRFPNDVWSWSLSAKEIGADFDPALGFVPRRGIRDYRAEVAYQPRVDDRVRNLDFLIASNLVTDTTDELETLESRLRPFGLRFQSGDRVYVELDHTREVLEEPFEIAPGVVVPDEDYSFARYRLALETAGKRELSSTLAFTGGDFFDGQREEYSAALTWSPGPRFSAEAEYSHNDVALPGGEFSVDVARLRSVITFTPDVAWSTTLQWDDRSERIGLFSRLRWIFRPGNELYVVFNESLDATTSSLRSEFEQLAFKLVYTLRF